MFKQTSLGAWVLCVCAFLLAAPLLRAGDLARVTQPDITLDVVYNPNTDPFSPVSLQGLSRAPNGDLFLIESDSGTVTTRVVRLPQNGTSYGPPEIVFDYQTFRSGTFSLPAGDWLYFGDEDVFEIRRVPLNATALTPAQAPALLQLGNHYDATICPQDTTLSDGSQILYVSANIDWTGHEVPATGNALVRLIFDASGDVTREDVAFIDDVSGPLIADANGALTYGRSGSTFIGLPGGLFRLPADVVEALTPAVPLNIDQPQFFLTDNASNAQLGLLNPEAILTTQTSDSEPDEVWAYDVLDLSAPRGFRLAEAFAADRGGAGSQIIAFESVIAVSNQQILFLASDFATSPATSILYRLTLPDFITYDFWAGFAFTDSERTSGLDQPDLSPDAEASNALQFSRNADPTVPDPARAPRLSLIEEAGHTFLTLDILEWDSSSDATTTVDFTDDLTQTPSWDIEAIDTGVTIPSGFRTQWRRYRAPVPTAEAAQGFLRQTVEVNAAGF
ncbi:MAG: hypothetical protein ACFBZ8_02565 [Opitutales bacterium]